MAECSPNPRGSKPKSPGRLQDKQEIEKSISEQKITNCECNHAEFEIVCLPSSHSGGELPGNQRGLSAGRGSQTLETPLVAAMRVEILEEILLVDLGGDSEALTLSTINRVIGFGIIFDLLSVLITSRLEILIGLAMYSENLVSKRDSKIV